VKKLKNIVDTLHNTSLLIYEAKKKAIIEGDEALLRQIGRGKDIMSILSTYTFSSSGYNLIFASK